MSDLVKHHRQLVGIAKGWAIANLPGWSEECHRDLLRRWGATAVEGRISATTLGEKKLLAVLDDYERRGWPRNRQVFAGRGKKAGGGAAARKVPPAIAHLVRLWGKLGMAGKIANCSRPALLAWCGRQTGREVPDLDSLETAELQRLTEALKGWLGR